MNSKRQTVWLVSMLSLMVVLSAYYLFTDDVNDLEVNSKELTLNEIKLDASQAAQLKSKQAASEVSAKTSEKQLTDAEILKQIQTQGKSGAQFFDQLKISRVEELSKRMESLLKIINDPSQNNTEAASQAYEEYYQIQELDEKVDHLEALLMRDFENAIVTQEENKFKVIVQANKLEKSQAVTIFDMMMKEMSVSPDKITVQYIN
jgi:stage III sporulation protein AH